MAKSYSVETQSLKVTMYHRLIMALLSDWE